MAPHCRYFASRGMVCFTGSYRLYNEEAGIEIPQSAADAISALRWVKANSTAFGIDSARVVAGGGSAGGHLMACAALISALDELDGDITISPVPNALVLFNPAMILTQNAELSQDFNEGMKGLEVRMGNDPKAVSPFSFIDNAINAWAIRLASGKCSSIPKGLSE